MNIKKMCNKMIVFVDDSNGSQYKVMTGLTLRRSVG